MHGPRPVDPGVLPAEPCHQGYLATPGFLLSSRRTPQSDDICSSFLALIDVRRRQPRLPSPTVRAVEATQVLTVAEPSHPVCFFILKAFSAAAPFAIQSASSSTSSSSS
jgi:hypothetical protein